MKKIFIALMMLVMGSGLFALTFQEVSEMTETVLSKGNYVKVLDKLDSDKPVVYLPVSSIKKIEVTELVSVIVIIDNTQFSTKFYDFKLVGNNLVIQKIKEK